LWHSQNPWPSGKPGGRDGKPALYREGKTPLAFYDLETDPRETRDVAKEHSDVVRRLEAFADKAREDLGDSATGQRGKGVRPAGRE
jgi:arylsulfatase